MNPKLLRSFNRLESQKKGMLSGLAALPHSQLQLRESPQSWSRAQVLDHVVKTEAAILDDVRSLLPSSSPVDLRSRMRFPMIVAVMRSPMRVRVPVDASQVLPDTDCEFDAISDRWSQVRLLWTEQLEGIEPGQLRYGAFRHPVSGWMTIGQTLVFLSAHLSHHCIQLGRIGSGTG